MTTISVRRACWLTLSCVLPWLSLQNYVWMRVNLRLYVYSDCIYQMLR